MDGVKLSELSSPIGLIAGSGTLPLEFLEAAREKGFKIITVAHRGETSSEVEKLCDEVGWVKVGQLGRLIKILQGAGVKYTAFAGGICKPRLFSALSLDWLGWRTLLKSQTANDDTLLRAVADTIEKHGIKVFASTLFLERSIPKKGQITRRTLTAEEAENGKIGWDAAEKIGLADIGQTVAVNRKSIVAVEAVEGTDACLKRAAELSGKGCVVVKLSKPGQDSRFDLPALGPETIQLMHSIGATAIIVRAGSTVLLEPEKLVSLANQHNIAIEAW